MSTQVSSASAMRATGHWSSVPGALLSVRSLLSREARAAGNSEMSEYYMAVIEDIEQDIARSSSMATGLPKYDPQGFLEAMATEMYMASRKRSQFSEDS